MPIVQKSFAMTTEKGTTIYRAGQSVSEDIAKNYPRFMQGHEEAEAGHNPELPVKLSRKKIASMSEEDLLQWLRQYHPGAVPAEEADKAALTEIVKNVMS